MKFVNHLPEMITAISAGLICLGIFVIRPILKMVFTHHQQLWGKQTDAQTNDRIAALEEEVKELRDRVNEHTLTLDGRPTMSRESVSERLSR